MKDNEQFWENYYAKAEVPDWPSPFAEWVYETYLSDGDRDRFPIMDCGCGNGRDAVYFALQGVSSVGVDICPTAIAKALQLAKSKGANVSSFGIAGMGKIDIFQGIYNVYSRFSLHAVDAATQDLFLSKARKVIRDKGMLFIEARSTKDAPNHKNADHQRRFIDYHTLVEQMEQLGYEIRHKEHSQGLAVFAGQDPWVIRIVASM